MRNFFRRLFGLRYLINLSTQEVHSLKNEHPNCRLKLMAKHNKDYVTEEQKEMYLKETLHDGCRWCMPERNHG